MQAAARVLVIMAAARKTKKNAPKKAASKTGGDVKGVYARVPVKLYMRLNELASQRSIKTGKLVRMQQMVCLLIEEAK